jgi:uncharacterized protein (TIRG00374 family)
VPKKKILKVLEYVAFLLFGIVLLWLSFRKLDLTIVWQNIEEADYRWLFLALVFAILSHITRAARWNLLISSMGYKTRLWTTFFAVMTGYMANTAVPRMGEFMRCGVLSKKENIPFNSLFGSVISERLFDMLVLVILIFFVIVFQLDLVGDFLQKIFGPMADSIFANRWNIIIAVSVFILLIILSVLFLKLYWHKIKQLSFYEKWRDFVKGLLDGIKTIKRMKQKWLFLFYTVLIWLFYAIMVYMPVLMLKDTSHLNFIDGLTILAIGSLGIVAPVPGGIGAYHFIVKAILFELYHINANAAGSFAAITHAGQTLLNVGVGGISYLILVLTKNQKPVNEKYREN